MSEITEIPFQLDEHTAYEVAEFITKQKQEVTNSQVEYLEEVIYFLEMAKTFYQSQEDE